jgi:hypothetical protein
LKNDFYPISHLITTTLAKEAGSSVQEIVLLFPLINYIIGIANIILLAFNVDERPQVQGLIISISILPIYSFFQTMYYPVLFSIYQLWFFLAMYYRTRKNFSRGSERLLFILILFFLPFLHPLGVIAAIVLLVSNLTFEAFYKIKSSIKKNNTVISLSDVLAPTLIIFISWFTWFSAFRVFGSSVNRIFNAFINEVSGQTLLSKYLSATDRGNLEIYEIARITILNHGPGIILGLLFGYLTIALMIKRISLEKKSGHVFLFILLFYSLGGLTLITELIASYPTRYINYSLGFISIFLGSGLINLFDKNRKLGRSIITILLCVSISLVLGIGVFNLHLSDFVGGSNNEFSYAQFEGLNFLFSNSEKKTGSIYSLVGGEKIQYALLPYGDLVETLNQNPNWEIAYPPAHFGYQGSPDESGFEFIDQEYLFATAFELGYYSLWPTEGRYTQKDFLLLADDYRWNKIYDSGDFILWIWRSNKEIAE